MTTGWDTLDVITQTLSHCNGEQILITGSAIIITIFKDYYLKQEENKKLAKQRINHQLELMKMKIQPHIFLGCLKNIYNDISCGNIYAPEMILKFSNLLSYILYDGELTQVPLQKEVNMISDYITLKKLTYKDKLDVNFEISGETDNYHIAPLLFLPYLEIFFAGEIESADKSFYLNADIEIVSSTLVFHFKSNISNTQNREDAAIKTMLADAKQKLEIVYFRRYSIKVNYDEDSFTIIIKLQLSLYTEYGQLLENDVWPTYEHT